MHAGDVLDDRFEIGPRAGEGAMGVVHRALDRATGSVVAVKLLGEASSQSSERFEREAVALARVDHPAVVRYVAHGVAEGRAYLAMEWLEGEPLDARISRAQLDVGEAMALARGLAQGLAALHAASIVHRDLKPSNIWLSGGDPAKPKVLDLGVAHLTGVTHAMTRTGDVLGTPVYMAPEQVRGLRSIDARCDVHAFGVVLFECLTKKRPFAGEHLLAVALKVLLEDPPRLRELVPSVPRGLEKLVADALRKPVSERPLDGADLVRRLALLDDAGDRGARGGGLTGGERHLLTLVLVEPPNARGGPLATTLGVEPGEPFAALRRVAAEHSADLELLSGRAAALVFSSWESARDQAAQAASAALSVRETMADGSKLAIATGRGELSLGAIAGVAIDRAVSLLCDEDEPRPPRVRIDDVTAGLLDERFELGGDEKSLELCGERAARGSARPVLGRMSPFVGRERELSALASLVAESIAESASRIALVTAPAGTGKSRLASETIARVVHDEPWIEVLRASGRPLASRSPFSLLAELVRGAAGIGAGEPARVQQRKLDARVGRYVDSATCAFAADFLGEMLGVGGPSPSAALRAARGDPKLLGERQQAAFVAWLEAECRSSAVVIVIDDLHWADRASVIAIAAAMRKLARSPLTVLGFGRPEVRSWLAEVFRGREVLEVPLSGLSKRVASKLAKELLAESAGDAAVADIVERADGNAFFLEELVRAHARGAAGAPETVIAMVGARIASLEPDDRRVLRAASVFGRVFPSEGARALAGGGEIEARLAALERRELLAGRGGGWAFAHELVRDAAYAMLTEDDRARGHRLAGEWLEQHAGDALELAMHFDLGGVSDRAGRFYARAAHDALHGSDLDAVLDLARRAEEKGVAREELADLRRVEAEVHAWRRSTKDAERCARASMELAERGSAVWFLAAAELAAALRASGDWDSVRAIALEMSAIAIDGAPPAQLVSLLRVARSLFAAGFFDEGVAIVERARPHVERAGEAEPLLLANLRFEEHDIAHCEGRLDVAAERCARAREAYERGGDTRRAFQVWAAAGFMLQLLGRYEDSARVLREALDSGAYVLTVDRSNLAVSLARAGRVDEALSLAEEGVELSKNTPRAHAFALAYLGFVRLARGELDRAAALIEEAAARATSVDREAIVVTSGLYAEIELARGNARAAIDRAQPGLVALAAAPRVPQGEMRLRCAVAEALIAAGDPAANASVLEAGARLDELASKIEDSEMRASFLADVRENARVVAMVRNVCAAPR